MGACALTKIGAIWAYLSPPKRYMVAGWQAGRLGVVGDLYPILLVCCGSVA